MGDELIDKITADGEQDVHVRESADGCAVNRRPIAEGTMPGRLSHHRAQRCLGKWIHVVPLIRRAAEFTGWAV